MKITKPVFLTIAGSDSGGSAGIQVDIRVASKLEFAATTCITAITAQNPDEITNIFSLPANLIKDQLETILNYYKPSAIKCGMISGDKNIQVIYEVLHSYLQSNLKNTVVDKLKEVDKKSNKGINDEIAIKKNKLYIVIDPVMSASSGKNLSLSSYYSKAQFKLFSLASLITPNIPECEKLLGIKIENEQQQKNACKLFYKKFNTAVLLKGGHMISENDLSDKSNQTVIDIFFNGKDFIELKGPLVKNVNSHGSGCLYSSALACYLSLSSYSNSSLNTSIEDALKLAKKFIAKSFQESCFITNNWKTNSENNTINELSDKFRVKQKSFLNPEFSLTIKAKS